MIQSLPNILSWSRIALAPLVTLTYLLPAPGPFVAVVLFGIAAFTDYVDGKIARVFNLHNPFGVFLDPVADKILVVIVLLTLCGAPQPPVPRGLLVLLATLVILREVVQSSLRDWMAQAGKHAEVGVTTLSKTKTVVQMLALGILLMPAALPTFAWHIPWLGGIGAALLMLAVVLGWVSLVQFLRVAWRAAGDN